MNPANASLCQSCSWTRVVTSARGSKFLLCRQSQDDSRFTKYPPQPIVRCSGYEQALPADAPAAGDEQAHGDTGRPIAAMIQRAGPAHHQVGQSPGLGQSRSASGFWRRCRRGASSRGPSRPAQQTGRESASCRPLMIGGTNSQRLSILRWQVEQKKIRLAHRPPGRDASGR